MLKNKLLKQALEHIQGNAQDPAMFEKAFKSGSRIVYDKKIFQRLTQGLAKSKDPVADVAKGITTVMVLLAQRAQGTLQAPALVEAGMALVLDALDFLEQSGQVKVDARVLDRATEQFLESMLPALGLTQQRLASVLDEVKQVMADPQKMQMYQQTLAGGAK